MCNYQGYEFGGGYLDSYCVNGLLHDADSNLKYDEDIPCPICNREGAIEWWYGKWEDTCDPKDKRSWDEINAEHKYRAAHLVDDIRKNRGLA